MKKIFIAGDSTAAHKAVNKRPESGWGEYLGKYMPNYKIVNVAENGRSTKSFINLGLLERINQEIGKEDVLLIQFGHNDGHHEDMTRYTTPEEYQLNLLKYIDVAKKHQAIPVLISSITRRMFEDQKLNPNALGPYPSQMKCVAEKENVLFIDMFHLSQELLKQFGEEDSIRLYLHLKPNTHINYPDGIIDNTHFTPYGAEMFAQMIANELSKLNI